MQMLLSTSNNEGEHCDTNAETLEVENPNRAFTISNMHSLYLQNIDHPGLVLIAKKLTGT